MVASVQGVQEVAILAVIAPGQMVVRLQDSLPHFQQLQVFFLGNHCKVHKTGLLRIKEDGWMENPSEQLCQPWENPSIPPLLLLLSEISLTWSYQDISTYNGTAYVIFRCNIALLQCKTLWLTD